MSHKFKKNNCISSLKQQQGAALMISLIMLALTSIIGFQSMRTSSIQEKMANNSLDRLKALQSAEAGVRYGVNQINNAAFSMDKFVNNINEVGVYDIRHQGAINMNTDDVSGHKTVVEWLANRSSENWPWDATNKRKETANHIDASNSMELIRKPQYAIGMQAPVLRSGSEGYQCIPYTVIGAGQGSTATTRVLIEVKVIPKSGCFRSTVKS